MHINPIMNANIATTKKAIILSLFFLKVSINGTHIVRIISHNAPVKNLSNLFSARLFSLDIPEKKLIILFITEFMERSSF